MILTNEVRKGLTPIFAVESEMSHVNVKKGAGKTTSHREPAYRCWVNPGGVHRPTAAWFPAGEADSSRRSAPSFLFW